MDLYNLKKNKLEEVERVSFDLEKDIQSLIEKNVETLFDLEFISSEFSVGGFRLDSLCFDNETNSFVVIEYKKGSSYSVIDQGYSYMSIMLNNKSDFILEYIEKTRKSLKKNDVDFSQSRILFISPSFNSYQKNSVNFKDVPFELWEIKRFSNNTISLNQHRSSSKESIQKIEGGNNTIIKDVNYEVKVLDEEDTMNGKNVSKEIKDVYYSIREEVSSWDDLNINCKKNYISFKKNKKPFVYFNFRKNFIRVHLLNSIKHLKDGTWGGRGGTKNPFILEDPKKMFSIWENKYKKLYSYDMKDTKDLDYFILMIKQKYDSLN